MMKYNNTVAISHENDVQYNRVFKLNSRQVK